MDKITQPLTRELAGRFLDIGELYAAMANGRWWKLRRNGKTQTWKTRPNDFRIPIKAGLKSCGAIEHSHFDKDGLLDPNAYRHVDDVMPNLRS